MDIEFVSNKLNKAVAELKGPFGLYVNFLSNNNEIKINENVQFWAASVVKLPIACVVYKNISDLTKRIKIKPENYVEGTGVIKLLDRSDEFTIKDLLNLMVAATDNTATNELVDLVGRESIESYMKELGMKDSTFRHKMFISAGLGPNLTTVADVHTLLIKLYRNEIADAAELVGIMKKQQDRRYMPLYLPNDILLAHKTGSLTDGIHDVGIVYAKKPFIFVFLSDDQPDKLETARVVSQCTKICFDYANQ